MVVTEAHFRDILGELIEENPIACQGVLSIVETVFTAGVDTLAVSLSSKPSLLVNLAFLSAHAENETEVKSLILHEFLHVLLNHTEQYRVMNRGTNIALDSIINAIIHRTLGAAYSRIMSRYYADLKGFEAIVRPMTPEEARARQKPANRFHALWYGIYSGRLVVDDVLAVASELPADVVTGLSVGEVAPGTFLIGGHKGWGEKVCEEAREALDQTMQRMNGHGIWRAPRGAGANPYETLATAKNEPLQKWEATAWRALRECITPDPRSQTTERYEIRYSLPVLSTGDRRAFLRTLWCPFIPDSLWKGEQRRPSGTTQVYLDVSGSMFAEMQAIVHLLGRLRRYIRTPFWAFSDEVAPAVIRNGELKTSTSGGTSINSVLEHVARSRPGKAVIVTDGYVERCDGGLLRKLGGQKLTVLLSRDGSAAELVRSRIPYVQLERYPS